MVIPAAGIAEKVHTIAGAVIPDKLRDASYGCVSGNRCTC
jgi:hypothetical protein